MTRLQYAEPPRRSDSGWSLVGFGLALVAAAFSGWAGWDLWRSLRQGASSVSFGVALVAVAAVCVVGLRRGRRRFAVAGLVLLVAAAAAMAVVVTGSPWSAPRAAPPAAPATSR